jgi:peptidoglycan/LPS O-acetylase OafA/YrhL
VGDAENELSYLNGIRGIAAFIVFLHHFSLAFYSAYYNGNTHDEHLKGWEVWYGKSIFSVFTNGNFAVCIFFILSGYVLSRKYFQSGSFQTLVSGAQRRFLRLYIPVAFTLLISYLFIKFHLYYNIPVSNVAHSGWWFGGMWDFPYPTRRLAVCLLYRTMFTGDSSFDTCLWSVSVELYYSLFVFALLALTHQSKNRLLVLCMVLFLSCLIGNGYLFSFALGISLNYIEKKVVHNKSYSNLLSAIFLICGVILGSFPSNDVIQGTVFENIPKMLLTKYDWYHFIGAYLFLLSFFFSVHLRRLTGLRPFKFLGRISYSFYLLHPIIIGSFSSYLFLKLYEHFGYNFSVVIVCFFTVGCCFMASWIMTKYVDSYGISLSRHIYLRYKDGRTKFD